MDQGFRTLIAALLLVSGAGCLSTSAKTMRFDRQGSQGGSDATFEAEFRRSCLVGDCRTQQVELLLPSGETLRGELTFHVRGSDMAGAVESPRGSGPVSGATGPASQASDGGAMNLLGDRGTRLGCEMQFTTGTRHGSGVCRASNGDVFDVCF